MSDRYAEERYSPKIPTCLPARSMRIVFDGKFLHFFSNGKALIYSAVSGAPSESGKLDYSLERQKLSNKGPIPQGEYWINPSELWENAWYRPGSWEAWGAYRITIHPFPITETYRRGGFFIHGGTIPGSIGCIDLTNEISRFISDLRKGLKESSECYIPLSVKYHAK